MRTIWLAALLGVPIALVPAATATTAEGARSVGHGGHRATTLVAAPKIVQFGNPVTLAGAITPAKPSQRVTVYARPCPQASSTTVVVVRTGPSGTYSAGLTPVSSTSYQAKWHGAFSALVPVLVRPKVDLKKLARHRFQIRVMAAQSLAGHRVLFQRHLSTGWSTLRKLRLTYWGQVISTAVSGKIFKARIHKRRRVRVLLSPKQAAPCYVSGHSLTIRS
jgi:hypothetical protein